MHYFRVSKKFGKEGGGGVSRRSSKIFCLTVPKISVGESSIVALISGTEKVQRRGVAEYHGFPSKLFCLTVPKKFAGNPSVLCFRKFPFAKKFMDKRGVSRCFVENFLSDTADIFRRGILNCCINFGYRKRLDRMGVIKIFCGKFFVSQCRNFP